MLCVLHLLLVVMSPEVACSDFWRKLLSTPFFKRNLVLLAVDEGHCVSEW